MALQANKSRIKGKPVKAQRTVKQTNKQRNSKLRSTAQSMLGAGVSLLPGGDIAKAGNALIAGGLKKNLPGMKKKEGGKKRRRGVVPKIVKRWATRYASKRKQAEKVIKKVFGSDGSKITGARKVRKYGTSPGIITAAEAREAMRK